MPMRTVPVRLSRMKASAVLLAVAIVLCWSPLALADIPKVRVGVLQYGTVNWELDTLEHHKLDTDRGVDVEMVALASPQATQVALQAGSVDVIVSDWIWVSRQRADGADYTFAPYSTAVGAVMVPAGSPLREPADLAGCRIGVAGGPLDKGWLLLRALAAKQGIDLAKEVDEVFAAPPLLNQLALSRQVDAVLTYWHYAARLEAAGQRRLMGIPEIVRALDIAVEVPTLGYVFSEAWAARNEAAAKAFLAAARDAKTILRDSDAEWQRLQPVVRAEDAATLQALRQGYRDGIPLHWGEAERQGAERLFAILAELGGAELVGRSTVLQPGTFWAGERY